MSLDERIEQILNRVEWRRDDNGELMRQTSQFDAHVDIKDLISSILDEVTSTSIFIPSGIGADGEKLFGEALRAHRKAIQANRKRIGL